MKVKKKELLAILVIAKRMAAPRSASAWLRSSRLRCVGMGDDLEFVAWGSDGAIRTVLSCDGAPGEAACALSADLHELVESALGDEVSIAVESGAIRVRSKGRSGTCEAIADSEQFCAPVPVAPLATSRLSGAQGEAISRALRLCVACVDLEHVQMRSRAVTIYCESNEVMVAGVDGSSAVIFQAPVSAPDMERVSITPSAAAILADVMMIDASHCGTIQFALHCDNDKLVVRCGVTSMYLLRKMDALFVPRMSIRGLIDDWKSSSSEILVAPRDLLDAARFADKFSTSKTSEAVLEWGPDEGVVRSKDSRGSTTIAMRSTDGPGKASFSAERIVRTLGGLDADERASARIAIDRSGKKPLLVALSGLDWTRTHLIMPMTPEEEGKES